jgi:exopolysaccharide biosynthesis polyprenyl glycosylphosphotransferase
MSNASVLGLNSNRGFPAHHESVIVDRYGRLDWTLRRLLAGSDVLALACALLLAGLISGRQDIGRFLLLGLPTLSIWVLLLRAYGLYDRDAKRINHSTVDDVPGLFHTLFIGSVLLWGYFRVLLPDPFFLLEVVSFAAIAMVLMILGRSSVRAGMRKLGPRNVLIVGAGEAADILIRKLQKHPEYGIRLVGQLMYGPEHGTLSSTPAEGSLPVLGTPGELSTVAREQATNRVIVSTAGLGSDQLLPLLRRCKELQIRVSVLPQMFEVMGSSVEVDDVEGMPILGLDPPVLSRSSRMLKRSMDVAGSLIALIVSAPAFLVIAIAVKLDSAGSVLFRQDRIGMGGRNMGLYKFRTMVHDAESRREELLSLSEDPSWLKLDADPRITRVGRLLRKSSLDELPQLLNVLKGEMSLVGPRPLIRSESERVCDWGRARLDLTPGITGLWQVLGRTSIPFEEMVKLDYLYVTNWSLWGDVRLLLRTLPAVVTRRGAN